MTPNFAAGNLEGEKTENVIVLQNGKGIPPKAELECENRKWNFNVRKEMLKPDVQLQNRIWNCE